MRKLMIAGNWKMNGSMSLIESFANAYAKHNFPLVSHVSNIMTLLCPPYVFLDKMRAFSASTGIVLGAQNLSHEAEGAFTGEISAAMLQACGCRYVLVGHSERRQFYGETDQIVAEKFWRAQEQGLIPILCVGESLAERQQGVSAAIVAKQLQAVIDRVGIQAFDSSVIAYEPLWAIGTGMTATPEQAEEIHAALRAYLAEQNKSIAEKRQILYGGSVKADNVAALLAMKNIDGALIGGASLDPGAFLKIIDIAMHLVDNGKNNG